MHSQSQTPLGWIIGALGIRSSLILPQPGIIRLLEFFPKFRQEIY